MCRLYVTAITGQRNNNSNTINSLAIAFRATRDCTAFRIEIFEPAGLIQLFPTASVNASGNPVDGNYPVSDPVNDDSVVAYFSMTDILVPGASISCGASIRIKITSQSLGCNCSLDEIFSVACKTLDPDSNSDPNNPGGNNNGGNNNGGITWPTWVCPFTARGFATIIWVTLIAVAFVVAGTGWIPMALISAGMIAAAVFLAAWILLCRPTVCAVLRLTLQVFVYATMFTFVIALALLSYRVGVLAALYGAVAAMIGAYMRTMNCTLPRIRLM